MDKNLLIVAGDPSGDLHAANLVRALKAQDPALRVVALGGRHLKEVADHFLFDLASLGISGFLEPLKRGLLWSRLLHTVRNTLQSGRISAVVCVDFYGFNHQVLGMAKHRHIPTFYYISPQVWASRPGRVRKLARLVDHMLLIFPFEVELYQKAGVPCTFVGHPLLDIVPEPSAGAKDTFKSSDPVRIGLLPGSRPSEIDRHLPLLLETLDRIRASFPKAQAQLFAAANLDDDAFRAALNGSRGISIVRDPRYEKRAGLDLALTCSGTATLENALLGVPMVVMYKVSAPTYWIAKALVRVPYIALANILLNKPLLPELIQADATPEKVAKEAVRLLSDPERLGGMRRELLSLRERLGHPGAAQRAAAVILEKLS
jgi:lipid-A-disaccharide synthase